MTVPTALSSVRAFSQTQQPGFPLLAGTDCLPQPPSFCSGLPQRPSTPGDRGGACCAAKCKTFINGGFLRLSEAQPRQTL